MPPLNTNDLDKIFNKIDKNGDGFVSLEELKLFLERIGFHTSLDELKLLVGKTCLDYIDFLFFYDIIIKGNNGESQINEEDNNSILEEDDDLRKAFGVFDLNGDGFISSEELQNALLKLGLWDEHSGKDCKNVINLYDVNSDGKLDFQEFKNMMLITK